eukprot:jgi/Antlo1/1953/125
MGCVQRVIGFILSPLRRNTKKTRSPKTTFSVSAQTEISNSSDCESESNGSNKGAEMSTEEDASSCREGKRRRASRQHKRRDQNESSLASESEKQGMSSADSKKQGQTKKKRTKNILGESVIVEKQSRKDKSREKQREKSANESQTSSRTEGRIRMQNTSDSHCTTRRNRADVQKSGKRVENANKRDVKRLGMSTIDSFSGTQTDYSFIIDNYVGRDVFVVGASDAHRQKDYSLLLKHRLCEYIESLDSHNNQNISFWE